MTSARLSRSIMLAQSTNVFDLQDIRAIIEETYDWPIGPHFTVEQYQDGSTTITITQGDK